MKKRIFALLVAVLALLSCKEEPSVKADFSIDRDVCKVNEEIAVKNLSTAGNTIIGLCKWEWDDNVCYEFEVGSVSFSTAGEHAIKLTVYAEDGVVSPDTFTRVVTVEDSGPGPGPGPDPSKKDFYVTVEGSGTFDGKSWENAFSATLMWEMLHVEGLDADADAERIAAINGATFHMGAGNYELDANPVLAYNVATPVELTFMGDYPAEGGESQTRDGASRANFTGGGTHAALILRGKIKVTFDGIGFIGGYGTVDENSTGVAAALDCDGKDAAGYANADISVTMSHCSVKNNTNNSYVTESHADEWGAGIRLRNVTSFVADSVTFAHNTSHAASALSIRKTSATLTHCVFTDNKVYHIAGAIYVTESSNARFEDCLFTGNSTETERAGVVHLSQAYGTFTNCTFKGNSSGFTGGVASLVGNGTEILFTDCVFGGSGEGEPNFSTGTKDIGGAGTMYLQDQSTATLRNCTITGDHSKRWGGSIYCNTTKGKLNLENCIFKDCYTTGCGGAITAGFKDFGEVKILGGAFINCSSTDGGAILADGKNGALLKIYKWNETEGTLFKGNHVLADTQYGGALKIQHKVAARLYGTVFEENYAGSGGAIYVTGGETSVYLDACSFDANYITNKWGTSIYLWAAAEFQMNNSSMRGSYTTNGNPADVNNARPAWIFFDEVPGIIGISNSTIIGDPQYYDGATFTSLTDNNTCLVCTTGSQCYLTNSIILPVTPSIHSVEGDYADGAHETIDAYYSHYSDLYGYKTLTDAGGNTGGLSMSSLGDLSWEDRCWKWNGLVGGSAPAKATGDDIYERLNAISPEFASWLGADFNYDQFHSSRGTGSWWPGAYQPE